MSRKAMRFLHFEIEDGRVVTRETFDTTELDSTLLHVAKDELFRELRAIISNLKAVATGDRATIKAALEQQREVGLPSRSRDSRFVVSLGTPGMALDNLFYADAIDLMNFTLWADNRH